MKIFLVTHISKNRVLFLLVSWSILKNITTFYILRLFILFLWKEKNSVIKNVISNMAIVYSLPKQKWVFMHCKVRQWTLLQMSNKVLSIRPSSKYTKMTWCQRRNVWSRHQLEIERCQIFYLFKTSRYLNGYSLLLINHESGDKIKIFTISVNTHKYHSQLHSGIYIRRYVTLLNEILSGSWKSFNKTKLATNNLHN